jgi:nicotinamidase-related amidase
MGKRALLVIDMQRYFVTEGGRAYLPLSAHSLPNVMALIEHFRNTDEPIIFTRHAHATDGSDLGLLGTFWEHMPEDGDEEAELDSRIKPIEEEKVITKNRYSAFVGTDLEEYLRKEKIDTVLITGVMTNLCCETTARDAFMRDFNVVFVADATASKNEAMHEATLLNMCYGFGDVVNTIDIIGS